MSTVVALGETHELEGFALAGVAVIAATSDDEVTSAWNDLDPEVGLLILTANAARILEPSLAERPNVLTAVMP